MDFGNRLSIIRKEKGLNQEQLAEMQAERDQIEAAKQQNEEMLKELMALKAQMAQQGMAPVATEPTEESAEKTEE